MERQGRGQGVKRNKTTWVFDVIHSAVNAQCLCMYHQGNNLCLGTTHLYDAHDFYNLAGCICVSASRIVSQKTPVICMLKPAYSLLHYLSLHILGNCQEDFDSLLQLCSLKGPNWIASRIASKQNMNKWVSEKHCLNKLGIYFSAGCLRLNWTTGGCHCKVHASNACVAVKLPEMKPFDVT